jgi:hypothetical protein
VVRSEVGVAIWWVVILGAAVAILPTSAIGRNAWIGFGLLTAFTLWTGAGVVWSSNAGASVTEVARVATYLAVFTLVLFARQPGDMRRLVNGLASGMALIGVVAILSRLHPGWFPSDDTGTVLGTRNRLGYPLDYWNGLAILMAMATPLLLLIAVRGRTVLGRALAAASIPSVALAAFLTLSRGGAIEFAVALIVFLSLAPRRLEALPSFSLAAVGSTILIVATNQRDALTNGIDSAGAHQQGNEILAMVLVVCGGAALIQTAIALAAKHDIGPRVRIPTRTTRAAWVGIGLCAVVVALAAGLPGEVSDRWNEFKAPGDPGTGVQRFDSANGTGRYQAWSAAADAEATHPLTGIGPGNFESWWAQNGTLPIFIRDAHSLYMETFGELGIVGLILIGGFVGLVLVAGTRRALRQNAERRWPYVAATASAAAFAVGAGIDWAWELSVLPIAFMVLAAGLLSPRHYRPVGRAERRATRAGLIALGIVGLIAIVPQLMSSEAIRDSRTAAASGNLPGALDKAERAHDLQPYAPTPDIQRALVLELMGKYHEAVGPAEEATRAGSEDWRNWLVLSRLQAEAGRAAASVAAYKRARRLNPRSVLFAQTQGGSS